MGIALSPDEKSLYVNARMPARVLKLPIRDDGSLGPAELFAMLDANPDGMASDTAGNLYVCLTSGDARVLNAKGETIGTLPGCTNLAFGDDDMKSLYLVGGTNVRRVRSSVAGLR